MAINTSAFETALQTKMDATSDAKEMLLLGKALESTVGSIAVSDINTAGATKVAEINTVATNTFKTVGGTAILGSGDIATLPSGGSVGQVLKKDGSNNASWGADEGGKVVKVTNVYNSTATSSGGTQRSLSASDFWYYDGLVAKGQFTKIRSDTILVVSGYYVARNTSGNFHGTYSWVGTNSTGSQNYTHHWGFDPYRFDSNRISEAYQFTVPSLAAGTYWACTATGRGDSGGHNGTLNVNHGEGDTPSKNARSSIVVMEILL